MQSRLATGVDRRVAAWRSMLAAWRDALGRSDTTGRRRRQIAFAIYFLLLLPSIGVALILGRSWAVAILLTIPALLLWRDRPGIFGATMVVGGAALRLSFSFTGVYTDGIEAAQLAWQEVLSGQNPYGHVLAGASQSNTIYPYGPLAMLAYIPGYWTEIVAACVLLALMARERAWIALAFTATFPLLVRASVNGQNDFLPCLLILLAVLAARSKSRRSVVFAAGWLSIAIAIKPYAAAWAIPMVGYGGVWALAVFVAAGLVLWSPVLVAWGVGSFLESERQQLIHHPDTGLALNVPILQYAAAPLALAGLLVRSWRAVFWLGLAVFMVFLYFSPWAGWGYIQGIGPVALLMLEIWAVERMAAGESSPLDPPR